MTDGCSNGSRTAPYGSTAVLPGCSNRVSRPSRVGGTRCSSRRKTSSTSSAAKIAVEEDWLRYGVTARRTRNQRRLAELHALRRKRREYRGTAGTARLDAAQADLSGRLVAAAEGVSKAFGDHILVRNFSIRVMRGD